MAAVPMLFTKTKSGDNRKTDNRIELRPDSKWHAAKRVFTWMDQNRYSNEKKDMADIVKLFARLNAEKAFIGLNTTKKELNDIKSDLHTLDTNAKFKDLDGTRAKVLNKHYDSVEKPEDLPEELIRQRRQSRANLESMDSAKAFRNMNQRVLEGIGKDEAFNRDTSKKVIGNVNTSNMFDDIKW